jgi:hypothetical protein
VWDFNSKLGGYELAHEVGVPTPVTHCTDVSIDDVRSIDLPDRVVLKPTSGAASAGVALLERTGVPGVWLDHMDGTNTSLDAVIERLQQLRAARRISASLLVEELLLPDPSVADVTPIPDDLKFYCFADRPIYVLQKRRHCSRTPGDWRYRMWDTDWNDLGSVKQRFTVDPSLQPPRRQDELVDVAQRLAARMAVPFVRIDLYETSRGVVFGEVTPLPGPADGFRLDVDRILGNEWEWAQRRLLSAGTPWLVDHTPGSSARGPTAPIASK